MEERIKRFNRASFGARLSTIYYEAEHVKTTPHGEYLLYLLILDNMFIEQWYHVPDERTVTICAIGYSQLDRHVDDVNIWQAVKRR